MSASPRSWLLPVVGALVALSLLAKVALLGTSQSLADGDEAVIGIMALHVLERGAHPVYPYGVRYGAGAALETHLAALFFALAGPSDVALKAAGLAVWTLCLGLVYAAGAARAGRTTGALAALLFGWAPQATLMSLKVSGGHMTAVALCLLAVWLRERRSPPWLAVAPLPLAALAHPIAAPFAALLALAALWGARGRARARAALSLAAVGLAAFALLRPPESGVWNPVSRGLDLAALQRALPGLVLTFFSANPNARSLPGPAAAGVSLLWLAALALAAARVRGARSLALYALAALPVLLVVRSTALSARHLLVLYPIACLVLARGLAPPRGLGVVAVALLVASGAFVQLRETRSPNVYGPGAQRHGLAREPARELVRSMEEAGVRYVYSVDPMFQWNVVFESRERIAARSANPVDRVPDYAARVDRARLAGEPVAYVEPVEARGAPRHAPQRFAWSWLEDRDVEAAFPLSPLVERPDPGTP